VLSKRLPIFLAMAAIIALTLTFFYKLAFTDLILARGDTYAYFYPYWGVRDAALSHGDLPLWTNNLFMGAPLLANSQLGSFYPPNWFTISLDPPEAIRVSILIHVMWAALGAFLLARRTLKLDLIPALIAGGAYGLGGHIGTHVEQINQLQGLSWLPWLVLLYDFALEKPCQYLPVMGMAWALQLLSGHTQTAFISGVGLGVYALVKGLTLDQPSITDGGITSRIRPLARPFFLLAADAIIAIVIASPQLLPTQELISISNRGGGLNQQEATAFSLPIELAGRGLLPSYDSQPFGEYIGYIGVIGLGLMVVGAFVETRRRWVWMALVVIGVIFAFGRFTPIYLTLAALPGFNLFRVPARWLSLSALGAAMLAGLGAQSLIGDQSSKRDWRAVAIFAAMYDV
jgi:hypothetical protein